MLERDDDNTPLLEQSPGTWHEWLELYLFCQFEGTRDDEERIVSQLADLPLTDDEREVLDYVMFVTMLWNERDDELSQHMTARMRRHLHGPLQ